MNTILCSLDLENIYKYYSLSILYIIFSKKPYNIIYFNTVTCDMLIDNY